MNVSPPCAYDDLIFSFFLPRVPEQSEYLLNFDLIPCLSPSPNPSPNSSPSSIPRPNSGPRLLGLDILGCTPLLVDKVFTKEEKAESKL